MRVNFCKTHSNENCVFAVFKHALVALFWWWRSNITLSPSVRIFPGADVWTRFSKPQSCTSWTPEHALKFVLTSCCFTAKEPALLNPQEQTLPVYPQSLPSCSKLGSARCLIAFNWILSHVTLLPFSGSAGNRFQSETRRRRRRWSGGQSGPRVPTGSTAPSCDLSWPVNRLRQTHTQTDPHTHTGTQLWMSGTHSTAVVLYRCTKDNEGEAGDDDDDGSKAMKTAASLLTEVHLCSSQSSQSIVIF